MTAEEIIRGFLKEHNIDFFVQGEDFCIPKFDIQIPKTFVGVLPSDRDWMGFHLAVADSHIEKLQKQLQNCSEGVEIYDFEQEGPKTIPDHSEEIGGEK